MQALDMRAGSQLRNKARNNRNAPVHTSAATAVECTSSYAHMQQEWALRVRRSCIAH